MKKVIKLTESDLREIVEKVLNEQGNMFGTAGMGIPAPFSSTPKSPARAKENINPKGLKMGDGGKANPAKVADVKKLQQKLMDLKFLRTDSMIPTGYFGKLTQQALDAYNAGDKKVAPSVVKGVKKGSESGTGVAKTPAVKQAAKCETGTEAVLSPNASLMFNGDKLIWLVGGKELKSWDAVSGLTWKNTPPSDWGSLLNRYVQSRQQWSKEKDAGPLPEGQYSVGPLETRNGQPEEIGAIEAFWYKLTGQVEGETTANKQFCRNTILSRISWGNYRLRINPTGGQKMYGRGDFYVHGGSLGGSHGCIDLTDEMEDFAKFFTVWSTSNGKKTIPMTVKYKNPMLNTIIQKLVNL